MVLTTGQRPVELRAAISSVRDQQDVASEIVVVVNAEGPLPESLDVGPARVVSPGANIGIPAGRNLGVSHLEHCSLVLFLDDDAILGDDSVLRRAVQMFERDPRLAVVTMRIVDPESGSTARRHVPRLVVGDPERSSWVTTFLGGASIVRVEPFLAAGGLPGEFFYAHEETSLAWRLLDRGYRIRYAADLVVHHPDVPPVRHREYHHLTARNRVLLARKHLPAPVATVYLTLWLLLGLVRSSGGRWATLRGFVDGFRATDVERSPIGWRTVARMTGYGRPPIL